MPPRFPLAFVVALILAMLNGCSSTSAVDESYKANGIISAPSIALRPRPERCCTSARDCLEGCIDSGLLLLPIRVNAPRWTTASMEALRDTQANIRIDHEHEVQALTFDTTVLWGLLLVGDPYNRSFWHLLAGGPFMCR